MSRWHKKGVQALASLWMQALLEGHPQSAGPRPHSNRSPEKQLLEEEQGPRGQGGRLVHYQSHSAAKVQWPVNFCHLVGSNLAEVAYV